MVCRAVSLIVFLHFFLCYGAVSEQVSYFIGELLSKYNRPFTVFEMCGDESLYIEKQLVKQDFDATFIGLFLDTRLPRSFDNVVSDSRVILLQVPDFTIKMFRNLADCEQPDVVIVHDVPNSIKKLKSNYIELFLNIGDFLCIDVPLKDERLLKRYNGDPRLIRQSKHTLGTVALFKTGKKGLKVPRWGLVCKAQGVPYNVRSNFEEKWMFKTSSCKKCCWHKGINLLTYIMLNGFCPTSDQIRKCLDELKQLEHNDLVIGNILIQGNALQPIDFHDSRRNMARDRCLEALTRSFEHSFRSPQEFLSYYRKILLRK